MARLPQLIPPVRRFTVTGGICLPGHCAVTTVTDPTLSGEAYTLTLAAEEIRIAAGSAVGAYRAEATLRQLRAHAELPCGVIEDAPDKAVRGLMLDVSRNRVYSLETLKWIVERMADLKLNRLELYFENVFAYTAHPTAWARTSPYSAEDMQTLSDFCAEHFIELVPNQNTLGHFERWLKADEKYRAFFELPQGGARTPWGSIQETPTGLCTTDPAVTDFVCGLLDELLPNFPQATSANLGGDEVFDLGQGRSAGKGDKAELYLNYMATVAETARKHGKAPELWADMLLRHREMLPLAKEKLPDTTWVLWGYEATDPLAQHAELLRAAGLRFLVSPGTSSWRSFCGRVTNMEANVRAACAIDCAGILLTDWGDAGHWQPLAITLPALVLCAALAWNGEGDFDWAQAIDDVSAVPGLGEFLLAIGRTEAADPIRVGNATRLFRDYNLPQKPLPADERAALEAIRAEVEALQVRGSQLGDTLLAREARYALALQRLAVRRALGEAGLKEERTALARTMRTLWLERGPQAQLEASLADFLAPELLLPAE